MVEAAVHTANLILPSDSEQILRLLLSVALGGIIGLERELTDHPAGIRTHISICLGSCLFGLISAYGFEQFMTAGNPGYSADVERVAAQIVVGVGFLGGGAIIKTNGGVSGLTTAASIWVTAAVGLGVALGMYTVTCTAALLLLITLVLMRAPQRWLRYNVKSSRQTVSILLAGDGDPSPVLTALTGLKGVKVRSLVVQENDERRMVNADVVIDAGIRPDTAFKSISSRDDVENVDFD